MTTNRATLIGFCIGAILAGVVTDFVSRWERAEIDRQTTVALNDCTEFLLADIARRMDSPPLEYRHGQLAIPRDNGTAVLVDFYADTVGMAIIEEKGEWWIYSAETGPLLPQRRLDGADADAVTRGPFAGAVGQDRFQRQYPTWRSPWAEFEYDSTSSRVASISSKVLRTIRDSLYNSVLASLPLLSDSSESVWQHHSDTFSWHPPGAALPRFGVVAFEFNDWGEIKGMRIFEDSTSTEEVTNATP